MSEELRECPHCGEEHICLFGVQDDDGPAFAVGCVTEDCPGHVAASWHYVTREKAIEAWNTRAERTCKFESDIINTAWDENDNEIETGEVADEADMYCGNCGYRMIRDNYDGWWDEEPGPYGGRFLAPRFNYCPKCGSKVIDWDGRKAVS